MRVKTLVTLSTWTVFCSNFVRYFLNKICPKPHRYGKHVFILSVGVSVRASNSSLSNLIYCMSESTDSDSTQYVISGKNKNVK